MQIDTTALICDALIQPFDTVPNEADDLMSLIATPLIRKLPVSFHEERKFPQFAEFIQTSDKECGSNLAKHISCLLTDTFEKQNLDDTTEDMMHWGIDSLIRVPLQIFRGFLCNQWIAQRKSAESFGSTFKSIEHPKQPRPCFHPLYGC